MMRVTSWRPFSLLKHLVLAFSALALAAAALVGGAYAWLNFDNANIEWALERGLSEVLQRELEIGAVLEARLGKTTYLVARDVRLANPDWAEQEDFANASHLILEIDIPSLWQAGPVLIHDVHLEQAQLNLLAPGDQPASWHFWPERKPSATPDSTPFPVIILQGAAVDSIVRYRDPDQDITANIESLQLGQDKTEELLTLDVSGSVNDTPLSARGQAGPARALFSGRGLNLHLQTKLGALALSMQGQVANLAKLEGVNLAIKAHSPVSRPLLDLLGVPEMRDGPLDFQGEVHPAGPGLAISATGKLGEFDLQLEASVEQPLTLDGVTAEFLVDGPSLTEAGAALEVHQLPDVPYSVTGKVIRRGPQLELSQGYIQAGDSDLRINGVLPSFPTINDWQAHLEGKAIQLSLVAPLIGAEDIPDQPYDITGTLGSNDQGVELVDLKLQSDSSSLMINGIVGEAPNYHGTKLNINLAGDDMSDTAPWVGLKVLPAQEFRLQGDVSLVESGWKLSNSRLQSPSLLVSLDGEMDRLVNASRVKAHIAFEGKDLSETLKAYGKELDQTISLPFSFSSDIHGQRESLQIEDGKFTLGENTGRISGALGDLSSAEQIDLQIDLAGPELRKLLPLDYPGRVGAAPYTASGKLQLKGQSLIMDQLSGTLPTEGISLSGKLQLHQTTSGRRGEGRLRIDGNSSAKLEHLLDVEAGFADRPFYLDASIKGVDRHFDLAPLKIVVGESDMSGSISFTASDTPHFDARLHSNYLHLPFLLPDFEELARQEETAGDEHDVPDFTAAPSGEELRERLIPDRPLPLEILRSLEGKLHYSADAIYLKQGVSTTGTIDLELSKGRLFSHTLAWDGTLSQGKAAVSIDASGETGEVALGIKAERLPLLMMLAGEPDLKRDSNYKARFSGRGNTLREVASSLNGGMLFHGKGGRMDNKGVDLVVGDLFGEIIDRLNPGSQVQPYTDVECNAGAAYARDGLLEVIPGFILRTPKADYMAAGTINLSTEAVNMAFSTRSRKGIGISAGKAVTNYLKVGGTLARPHLTLDAKGAAVSGSAAIATAGWSILAEGLWDRWVASSGDPCKRLEKKARDDKKRDYQHLLDQAVTADPT